MSRASITRAQLAAAAAAVSREVPQPPAAIVFVARYESRNYVFDAYGATADAALAALLIGIAKHAEQCNLDPAGGWLAEVQKEIADDDAWLIRDYGTRYARPFKLGSCYRDREPIEPD